MRLAIVTAIWRRPELTNLVLEWYAEQRRQLAAELEIIVAVAGSEGMLSQQLAMRWGHHYVEVPNMPLNRKFNAAARLAKGLKPDAIMVIGSDSIMTPGYLLRAASRVQRNGLYAPNQLYQFDLQPMHLGLMNISPPRHQGNGRTLSCEVMDEIHWRPWPQRANLSHGLDAASSKKLARHGLAYDLVEPLGDELNLNIRAGENVTRGWHLRRVQDFIRQPIAHLRERLGDRWTLRLLQLREQLWPPKPPSNHYIPGAWTFYRFNRWRRSQA